MRKKLLLIFLPVLGFSQIQIGKIDGNAQKHQFGTSVSISADGSVVAVGAGDYAYTSVYKNLSGVWTQIGTDINGEANVFTGYKISLSGDGNVLACADITSDVNAYDSGQVRIYKNIAGVWTQIGANIYGEAYGDMSGSSISLSTDGSIVAIGAMHNGGNGKDSGHVRVYKNISGVWTQMGADINGEAAGFYSGNAVSLSGDGSIVAVGSPFDTPSSKRGSVSVYKNNSGVWTLLGTKIYGEATGDYSAVDNSLSISADGNVVAIGAIYNSGNGATSGHVRLYKNISGVWTKIGADIDGESSGDQSGNGVSLSADGNIVAIGAMYNDGNGKDSGHVRVYKNVSSVWTRIGVDIDGDSPENSIGKSISLSADGKTLAVGTYINSLTGFVKLYSLTSILSTDSFVLANFLIYPNPVSEELFINLQENLTLKKVNIYNNLGQLIKTDKQTKLNVSALTKGNYFVEVITNEGKATKKIIIE